MTVAAGSRILAGDILAISLPYGRKSSNQSVTSSTVLVNDTQLLVAVSPNRAYDFELKLLYNGGTTGASDIKVGWSVPAGATMLYQNLSITNPLGVGMGTGTQSTTTFSATNGTGTTFGCRIAGTIVVSATSGTLQMQWAQNTSNATATTVLAGSSLVIRDIT